LAKQVVDLGKCLSQIRLTFALENDASSMPLDEKNDMIARGGAGPTVTIFAADAASESPLPLAFPALSAGFPSAALDFDDRKIDLNRELIPHPSTTFFGRVKGNSMQEAGIGDGDLLVIDKSLDATDGRIAVCFIDGEFTVKRIHLDGKDTWLMPANPAYSPLKITDANDFRIWGVVTYSIKALLRN
jgi:DNA polymerase V